MLSMNQGTAADPRLTSMDHIPQYIKDDFKLPKDMSGLDIDYFEVRRVDAMFKRR